MNYLSAFKEIVKTANNEERYQNQTLSDLNLISSELKDNLKSYEKFMEDIRNLDIGISDSNLYFAIEYNNALLLSSLNPDNFMNLLQKAVKEKRYYFFFTAAELFMGSKINSKIKMELQIYVNYIKEELGLVFEDINPEIYNEVIVIANKILDLAIDNFYLFKTISTEVLSPYIETHDPKSSKFIEEINLANLGALYREIMHYVNALGMRDGN